ncbi:MAG TPA: FMN-binding protein [Rhizomicrobium sp.]|jgi:uncharacterized protein with FMN-binding domain|nr:FMN-binding protein [Rhizomicrobium sp.]
MIAMPGGKHQNLAARLLLSSALVAVSLAYAWWHRHNAAAPHTIAVQAPPATHSPAPAMNNPAMTARIEPPQTAPSAPKPLAVAAPPQREIHSPASVPVSALASLRMYQPPPAQTPLPLVTGASPPGVTVPIPVGSHLEDGDYLSDTQVYEWGDLQVKISVHGGQITGVQMTEYPDHRAESLQISQMASPLLGSEVIKTQQAKVDVVSSATDTSYVFRDAIASAIKKATR